MKIYVPQVELVRIDPFPPLIKMIEWFCFLKCTYNIALATKENRKIISLLIHIDPRGELEVAKLDLTR